MPPAVLASALTRWTRMRSRRGARALIDFTVRAWEFLARFVDRGLEVA